MMASKRKQYQEIECACTFLNLRKATRAVNRFYDGVLAPSRLRATQMSVLVNIGILEDATISDLAERLIMDRTTLTRNLRPLIRQGLVKLRPGADRRTRIAVLTPKGRAAVDVAIPFWEQAQTRVVSGLGQDRWQHLVQDLAAVTALGQELE